MVKVGYGPPPCVSSTLPHVPCHQVAGAVVCAQQTCVPHPRCVNTLRGINNKRSLQQHKACLGDCRRAQHISYLPHTYWWNVGVAILLHSIRSWPRETHIGPGFPPLPGAVTTHVTAIAVVEVIRVVVSWRLMQCLPMWCLRPTRPLLCSHHRDEWCALGTPLHIRRTVHTHTLPLSLSIPLNHALRSCARQTCPTCHIWRTQRLRLKHPPTTLPI